MEDDLGRSIVSVIQNSKRRFFASWYILLMPNKKSIFLKTEIPDYQISKIDN